MKSLTWAAALGGLVALASPAEIVGQSRQSVEWEYVHRWECKLTDQKFGEFANQLTLMYQSQGRKGYELVSVVNHPPIDAKQEHCFYVVFKKQKQ